MYILFSNIRLFLFFKFLLLSCNLISQSELTHWHFGGQAELDFSSGIPKVGHESAYYDWNDGTTISNSDGNLLFYTDGGYVFNKTHSYMDNNYHLLGGGQQSAAIVPHPGNEFKYYIFTTSPVVTSYSGTHDEISSPSSPTGFLYYTVDMSLSDSLGSIENSFNNKLLNNTSNKVSATHHGNGKDFWVVTHFQDKFYSYKVTELGLNPNPIISNIGASISPNVYSPLNGYIKISPSGNKLAVSHRFDLNENEIPQNISTYEQWIYPHYSGSYLAVYDFDSTTGVVYNESILSNEDFVVSGGIEFSHDSKYLYANFDTYLGVINWASSKVVQYDLDNVDIQNSAQIIFQNFTFDTLPQSSIIAVYSMQLGLDGKIYYASNYSQYLSIIHNPHKIASQTEFEYNALPLFNECFPFSHHQGGLPNLISSFFKEDIYFTLPSCLEREIKFYFAIEAESIIWDFGDGQSSSELLPTHTYAEMGDYLVSARVFNDGIEKVYQKEINIKPNPIANDAVLEECDNDLDGKAIFNLNHAFLQITNNEESIVSFFETIEDAERNCNPIINTENYEVNIPVKIVYVRVENKHGCIMFVELTLIVKVGLNVDVNDQMICSNNGEIIIEIPSNYTTYMWEGLVDEDLYQPNDSNIIRITKAGEYSVTITNENDCEYTDHFTVGYYPLPEINKMNFTETSVQIISEGNTPFQFSLDGVFWQSSNTFHNLLVNIYSLYIKDRYGCVYKMDDFSLFVIPNLITPNNDGYNDAWKIRGLSIYDNVKVQIFDRYGKTILNRIISNQDEIWDGNYLGRPAPTGSYWYIIEVAPDRRFTGHISVKNN